MANTYSYDVSSHVVTSNLNGPGVLYTRNVEGDVHGLLEAGTVLLACSSTYHNESRYTTKSIKGSVVLGHVLPIEYMT